MPKRLARVLGVLFVVAVALVAYGNATHQFAFPTIPSIVSSSTVLVTDAAKTFQTSDDWTASTTPPVAIGGVSSTTSTVVTNAVVIRAVDGDTLVVRYDGSSTEDRIRLLGINTPETVDPRKPVECFGKEASAHMHAMIDGKRIRLDEDPQADNVDKYGRLLRNVTLEDGTDVNAAMVRDGYAYAYLSFPLDPKRKTELKKLENDARLAERGLWSPQTCNGKP